MRYRPALADTRKLRLRKEWQDIDPHQKTILSDELAMGFIAALLIRKFEFQSFANTLYFVKSFSSGSYFLKGKSKNGQNKSPDFVSLDSNGRLSVFECKGTQQNRRSLRSSTELGVIQKKNFGAVPSASLEYSLVLGLFIPQFTQNESALMHLKDPEFSDLTTFLRTIPGNQQEIGIVQIDLAKHFALMGLSSIANALASRVIDTDRVLSGLDTGELNNVVENDRDHLVMRKLHTLPARTLILEDQEVRGISFSVSCPREFYMRLTQSNDVSVEISKFAHVAKASAWKSLSIGKRTELHTPLGFIMSLEYESERLNIERNESARRIMLDS